VHILDERAQVVHRVAPPARLVGGELSYDAALTDT
jgi:hypothetical protein